MKHGSDTVRWRASYEDWAIGKAYTGDTSYLFFILTIVFLGESEDSTSYISYVEQKMDFQLGSIHAVKSCKIASISYASRAKHCTLPIYSYIAITNAKPIFSFFKWATRNRISIFPTVFFLFQIWNRKYNFNLVVHSQ